MSDHPYDEQAKYYEQRECELQDEIERLREDLGVVDVWRNKVIAENERLRAALSRYGEHAPGCSSRDVMDCGRSFVRADWPCDCGFREALQEGES